MKVIHVPITDVPQPGVWARKARCRTAPTSVFFPTQGDDVEQARAICRGCAVLAECREYALTYPSLGGVWAALSELERERMHQKARLVMRPAPMALSFFEENRNPQPVVTAVENRS